MIFYMMCKKYHDSALKPMIVRDTCVNVLMFLV